MCRDRATPSATVPVTARAAAHPSRLSTPAKCQRPRLECVSRPHCRHHPAFADGARPRWVPARSPASSLAARRWSASRRLRPPVCLSRNTGRAAVDDACPRRHAIGGNTCCCQQYKPSCHRNVKREAVNKPLHIRHAVKGRATGCQQCLSSPPCKKRGVQPSPKPTNRSCTKGLRENALSHVLSLLADPSKTRGLCP